MAGPCLAGRRGAVSKVVAVQGVFLSPAAVANADGYAQDGRLGLKRLEESRLIVIKTESADSSDKAESLREDPESLFGVAGPGQTQARVEEDIRTSSVFSNGEHETPASKGTSAYAAERGKEGGGDHL